MYRIATRIAPLLGVMAIAACSSAPRATAPGTPLSVRLAAADAGNGRRIFRQCAACHNLSDGGTDRDGPNLWGALGRPLASASARFAYTAAFKNAGGTWTCARMDRWLENPAGFVPGTAMIFAGLADGGQRADVIAYLARNGGTIADATCAPLAERTR